MSRTRLYGSTNGTPFQRSTMTFDDVPMPIANRPGRGVGQRRHATAPAHAGARVNAGTIAVPSRSARRPRRRQRERRERVGAVGLGRPHVGVAEVGQLFELGALRVERAPEGHGHAGADGQGHGAGR